MSGKQALESLRSKMKYEDLVKYASELESIQKDLEALEVVKNYITVKEIHTRKISEPIGGVFVLLHVNVTKHDDAMKVKEWLENE